MFLEMLGKKTKRSRNILLKKIQEILTKKTSFLTKKTQKLKKMKSITCTFFLLKNYIKKEK